MTYLFLAAHYLTHVTGGNLIHWGEKYALLNSERIVSSVLESATIELVDVNFGEVFFVHVLVS